MLYIYSRTKLQKTAFYFIVHFPSSPKSNFNFTIELMTWAWSCFYSLDWSWMCWDTGQPTALPPISKLKNIEFHNIIEVHICSYYVTPSSTIPVYKIYINAYILTLIEDINIMCSSSYSYQLKIHKISSLVLSIHTGCPDPLRPTCAAKSV